MDRIVILGAGHVGSMCALNLALQGVGKEIVLIDILEEKADAQAKDVTDATIFMKRVPVIRKGSYRDCDEAAIIVNAVGVSRQPGQTRLDMLDVTVDIMKEVIGKLKETRFDGIFISISNPCDVIANYARLHLNLPEGHVFGTGTALDTARLRVTLSQLTGLSDESFQCFAMGEHGNSSMIPMSNVRIMGKLLEELKQEDPERLGKVTEAVLLERTHELGNEIVEGKGSTEFGIGAAAAEICRAVLEDEKKVLPVSAHLVNSYGQRDIMAGVPAIIGKNGVEKIIELHLTDREQNQFNSSCDVIRSYVEKAEKR